MTGYPGEGLFCGQDVSPLGPAASPNFFRHGHASLPSLPRGQGQPGLAGALQIASSLGAPDKKGRRHGVLSLSAQGVVTAQIGLKMFSQCHDGRSICICIPHGPLPVAPLHDMAGRDRKRTLVHFQANTVLSTCFCRIFYLLPIQYLPLFFSVNNSIAIPAHDTSYLSFRMACKKDNCHTIHRHSFFAGPQPFQMQADRLSISISYRYITIAISISVDEIGYLFPCLVYTHVFEARNECSRTIIPFHPAYIKAYESHIPS